MHYHEALELAARIVGVDPDANDFDEDDLEKKLYEKFDMDMGQFQKLAEALVKFTIPAETAITGTMSQGFVHDGAFICKSPYVLSA